MTTPAKHDVDAALNRLSAVIQRALLRIEQFEDDTSHDKKGAAAPTISAAARIVPAMTASQPNATREGFVS